MNPDSTLTSTNNCPKDGVHLYLLAWLENDLPEEESELINTHVADCDECRETLALMGSGCGEERR